MPVSSRSAVIVGAGLAGSLLAVYLARAGWRVGLHERRPDPRAAGYLGGRSINLAMSARGLWGLAGVGLEPEVLAHAIPMRGRMIHPVAGPVAFQPYSKSPIDAINSISRGGLNLALLHAAAREPSVQLHFNQRCADVDLTRPAAHFSDETTGATSTVEADLIAGADGAFSPVRMAMQKADRFDYSQSYLEHGYKELHIPPASSATGTRHTLDPNALHIWPRGGAMMIALPNPDGSFTCTLFWPFDGPHGLNSLTTPAQVGAFFAEHYPDAAPLMPTLEEDYLRNPSSSLVTVRCSPWVRPSSDKHRATVLIGDAAHAIVPFYGQGMNAAFEDCRVLADCLAHSPGDFAAALDRYQILRKPDADAIAAMALENFVEMRDKVGSKDFLYRKRLEHAAHELMPDELTPQYHLVSFTTVPYAEARRRGRRLDGVLTELDRRLPREAAERLSPGAWLEQVRALLPAALSAAQTASQTAAR
jgi:kynurenine 3-monooxygenase